MASYKFAFLCAALMMGAVAAHLACPSETHADLMGGFSSVDANSSDIAQLTDFVSLSLEEDASAMNTTMSGCDFDSPLVEVGRACTQVVQGTNTILEFVATVTCEMGSYMAASGAVMVYTPLPYEDAAPELLEYDITWMS